MSNIPVLIVGAGPTGLLMACELARHGIAFRIIDKKYERTLTSNAVWVQTRTIELFDEIGIADRFLRVGQFCKAINLYSQGKPLVKISLDTLDSIYQFVLMISQSDTELLLATRLEELGSQVERAVELVSIKKIGNTIEAGLQHGEGEVETVTCDWLIACDGANSTVREKCQIYFSGEDMTEQFVVADAQMDSFLRPDEIHAFLDKGTILAAFPLGSNKYRLGANLHLSHPRKLYTEKEVKEIVIERAYGDFNVESVSWISPFWIHSKVVEKMRDETIFFAGDAAHIHAPVSGQGMNTGLQDAYNLAWKLALVIKGNAKPALLDSYQLERYPVVKDIVDRSEKFTKMVLTENPFMLKIRNIIYKLLHSQKSLSKKVSMRITQLAIQYKNSPVINYTGKINSRSPKPGERAPNVIIDKSRRLHDYLRGTQHNVLLFAGNIKTDDTSKLIELKQWFNNNYAGRVQTNIISKSDSSNIDDAIIDVDSVIHEKYGVITPTVYIIRPDNYIAYCGVDLNIDAFKEFMKLYFVV